MIAQLLYIALAVGAAVGCAHSFRRSGQERRERTPLDQANATKVERAKHVRDVAQSYGRSVLAVAAGGWAVLVALSCLLTIVMGRA